MLVTLTQCSTNCNNYHAIFGLIQNGDKQLDELKKRLTILIFILLKMTV